MGCRALTPKNVIQYNKDKCQRPEYREGPGAVPGA